MLRDVEALEDWVRREQPAAWVEADVRRWVAGLAEAPWQAPSIPDDRLSDYPVTEYRWAALRGCGVAVFYRRTFADEVVDLIAVTGASRAELP